MSLLFSDKCRVCIMQDTDESKCHKVNLKCNFLFETNVLDK